jgi:hypothetical protein
MRLRFVLGLVLLTTLTGCTHRRLLGYDQQRIMAVDGPPLDASITIQPFVDKRAEHEGSLVFTAKRDTIKSPGYVTCINAERNYVSDVPQELAEIITQHIDRRGLFHPKSDRSPKYTLQGSLVALYGIQQRSRAEQSTHIEILFSDLRLRSDRGLDQQLPDTRVVFDDDRASRGNCEKIYTQVDLKLKLAVEKLAAEVENAVRTASPGRNSGQRMVGSQQPVMQ